MVEEIYLKLDTLFKMLPFILNSKTYFKHEVKSEGYFMFILDLRKNFSLSFSVLEENDKYFYRFIHKKRRFFRKRKIADSDYYDNTLRPSFCLEASLYTEKDKELSFYYEFNPNDDKYIESVIDKLTIFNEEIEKSFYFIDKLIERIQAQNINSSLVFAYIFSKGFCVFTGFLAYSSEPSLSLYSYVNRVTTVEEIASLSDDDFSKFVSFSEEAYQSSLSNEGIESFQNKYEKFTRKFS